MATCACSGQWTRRRFKGLWSGLCGVGLWSFVSTQLVHAQRRIRWTRKVARLRSVSAMISDEILANFNEAEDALLMGLLSKMMAKRGDHGGLLLTAVQP
jgi:hypothetical protein